MDFVGVQEREVDVRVGRGARRRGGRGTWSVGLVLS